MRSRKNAVPVPVTRDLLQEKQTEVARLARQASEAVDIVTRTMNELEGINQQIDNDLAEIDTYYNAKRGVPLTAMFKEAKLPFVGSSPTCRSISLGINSNSK